MGADWKDMNTWTLLDLILSALFTWGLGILPAYLIRFKIYKRPLKKRYAIPIIFFIYIAHVILSEILMDAAGYKSSGERRHTALSLVLIVNYFILRKRVKTQREES